MDARAARPRPASPGRQEVLKLDQFGRNLTKLASEGKLDPVVGRETEVEHMQILSAARRTTRS